MVWHHCCVPGCKNRKGRVVRPMTWHAFPKREDIRKMWIIAIRRDVGKHFQITRHTTVCSEHFTKEDFKPLLHSKRKYLKPDAVPSVFSFNEKQVNQSSKNPKYRSASSFTSDALKKSNNAMAAPSTDSQEQEILGPRLACLLDPTSDECEISPVPRINIKTEPPDVKEEPVENTDFGNIWEPQVQMTVGSEEPVKR